MFATWKEYGEINDNIKNGILIDVYFQVGCLPTWLFR